MSEQEYRGKAKELVRILRTEQHKLSPEMIEKIQGWIVSEDSLEQKDREFRALFDELVHYNAVPSAKAFRMNKRWRIANRIGNVPHRPLLYSPLFRVAAVIIPLLFLTGWLVWNLPHTGVVPQASMIRMHVPDTLGAQGKTELADGSDILIRPGSTIRYAGDFSTENVRRLVLDAGEIYLDVAPDSSKQFVVETPHLNVHVLGTRFDVESMPDRAETVVTLYQGRILVDRLGGKTGSKAVEMTPGERLVCQNASGEYRIETTESLLPEWIAQRLTFKDTPYNEILRTIEWFYGVRIEIDGRLKDDTRLDFRFTGREDIHTAMWLFRKVSREFSYEITRSTVRIQVDV